MISRKEQLIEAISSHKLFPGLSLSHQERILCPAYIKWVEDAENLLMIDRGRMICIIEEHGSLPQPFKNIYLDILKDK